MSFINIIGKTIKTIKGISGSDDTLNITDTDGSTESIIINNVKNAVSATSSTTATTATKASQDALGNTISDTYAPLASPTFTGIPAAPTAASNTNTTQLATTAFVANALASFTGNGSGAVSYTTSATLSASDSGKIIICNSATAMTLTLPTTLSASYDFNFMNIGAGTVTIAGSSTNQIYSATGVVTSLTINQNTSAHLSCDGTSFYVDAGSQSGGIVAQLLDTNGYVKFANGLIIQWGNHTSTSTGNIQVTYPLSFTSKALCALACFHDAGGESEIGIYNLNSLAAMTVQIDSAKSGDTGFYWIAIGI
jgi:hypothetical protein